MRKIFTQPSVVIYYITFFDHVSKVSKYCCTDKLPIGAVALEPPFWILLTKMPIYFYSSLHNLATEIFTKIFPFYETIKWPD